MKKLLVEKSGEGVVLRHAMRMPRGCGAGIGLAVSAYFLYWAWRDWPAAFLWVAFLAVVLVVILEKWLGETLRGEVYVGGGMLRAEADHGYGDLANQVAFADVLAIEYCLNGHRAESTAMGDEGLKGLHAVTMQGRVCLIPEADVKMAREAMEAIAEAAPELRGRMRWESCNGML